MAEIETGTGLAGNGGFLQDDSGNSSSTRLIAFLWFLGLVVAFIIATLRSTAVGAVGAGGLPDIPWGVVTLSAAVLGGKQVGKWIEMLQAIQALKEKCLAGGAGKEGQS